MINNIKTFGKFLDQPVLISKLNKSMPYILSGIMGGYSLKKGKDTFEKSKNLPNDEKKKNKNEFYKNTFILAMSLTSALAAPYMASKITGRKSLDSIQTVYNKNNKLIDSFLNDNKKCFDDKTLKTLNKAKTEILSFEELRSLMQNLNTKDGKNFINKLIPDPENLSAKDIFSEIGYLSLYGAIPVVGGIGAGCVADAINKENLKKTIPNKINEGMYQYLANIFMCNVGAGIALAILEKANIQSKSARAVAMIAGIVLSGIVCGSKIANFVARKVIDPVAKTKTSERKPELIDLGMHADDIATVAVLSGLKWIEPSLPFLYTISGYKSGIGYRN